MKKVLVREKTSVYNYEKANVLKNTELHGMRFYESKKSCIGRGKVGSRHCR